MIAEDYELGPVAANGLAPAVGKLHERFDGAEIEVYLASLLALDPDVWGGLGELLRDDAASQGDDGPKTRRSADR